MNSSWLQRTRVRLLAPLSDWALPPDEYAPPSTRQRLGFLLFAIAPWIALYEFTVHLHLPGRPFQFAFEDGLAICPWTALIYQSIYLVVAVSPWLARTRHDLRQLTLSVWLSLAIVFPFYWILPSQAPRRTLASTSWIAQVLQWERSTYPPTAAFPSYHALWVIFLARLFRRKWVGVTYAAAVMVSCISTGMHYIPDILASLAISPLLLWPQRIWECLRNRLTFPSVRGAGCQPACRSKEA
jgi:membrane-bound metal-dependent hydrolase YbcI (DUF457 family)